MTSTSSAWSGTTRLSRESLHNSSCSVVFAIVVVVERVLCHRATTGLTALVDRLVGLSVKASTSGTEDPEFDSRLRRGSSPTSDLKN